MSSPETCNTEFSPVTRGFNASIRSGMTQAARDKVRAMLTSDEGEGVVVAPFRYYIGLQSRVYLARYTPDGDGKIVIFSEYERDDAYAGGLTRPDTCSV